MTLFPLKISRSLLRETDSEPMSFGGYSFVLVEERAPYFPKERARRRQKTRNLSRVDSAELPRERLCRDGAESLSIQELIAILLRTGMRGKPVLMLAQELLLRFGSVEGLAKASVKELKEVKGIGEAKAILLKAALSLATRLAKAAQPLHPIVADPEAAFEIAKTEIGHFDKEVLLVLLRDARGRLIHREVIAIGTLSEVLIHPREIFHPAVRHGAHSLVLVHNHPSGDPSPSRQDIQLTRCLLEASRIMGIALHDHLIVGKKSFFSLRRHGYFDSDNGV